MAKYYVRVRGNRVISFSQKPIKPIKENEIIIQTNELPSNDPMLMEYKNGVIVKKVNTNETETILKNRGKFRRKKDLLHDLSKELENRGKLKFEILALSIIGLMKIIRLSDSIFNDSLFIIKVLLDYNDPISYIRELDKLDEKSKEEIIEIIEPLVEVNRIANELKSA